jgi:AcrR family transcriptional regulator
MVSGMARPVNADAEATRRNILSVATRLFAEQGPRASLRSVAGTAGVSLATVHHYFGSKQGLREACVAAMDAEFDGLRDQLTAIAQSGESLDAIVERSVRRAYRFALDHQWAVRLTARTAIDRGELEPSRQAGMLLPGLGEGAALLARITGTDPAQLRLVLRSVSYLVVRYSLTDPAELAMVLGWDPEDADEEACTRAVEDHLVFVARSLLAAAKNESTEGDER